MHAASLQQTCSQQSLELTAAFTVHETFSLANRLATRNQCSAPPECSFAGSYCQPGAEDSSSHHVRTHFMRSAGSPWAAALLSMRE